MKNTILAIFSIFSCMSASAAGVLINGNQINPQTAISISTLTVTGAQGATVSGQETIVSTLTVKGNAFSVGGSTIVISGGFTSFGGNGSPGQKASVTRYNSSNNYMVVQGTASGSVSLGQLGYGSATPETPGTAVLTWTDGGRVGIGTASPGVSLDVNGQVRSLGITDGTTVPNGYVTQYSSSAPTGDVTVPATAVNVSIATMTLTAGRWRITGSAFFSSGAALTATQAIAAISLTAGAVDSGIYRDEKLLTGNDNFTLCPVERYINITVTTPVYLVVLMKYSANTGGVWSSANSIIQAERR